MTELFLNVFNLSISATWFILAVFIARLVLKRSPKWIMVLFWGIVALRLICPFSIESAYSLIPEFIDNGDIVTDWKEDYAGEITIIPENSEHYKDAIYAGREPIVDDNGNYYVVTQEDQISEPVTNEDTILPILASLWMIGMAFLSVYCVISYWRIYRQVSTAVLYKDNIYQSDTLDSPFLFGIFHPRIYLPFDIKEESMKYVIAHEMAHLKRRDHWWKLIGFLLLTIHWFNPFMWIAYLLLCRDLELACDEKVIKDLTPEERADYSQTLLICSIYNQRIFACPVAFGEVGVKERIKSIFQYKKPTILRIVLTIVLCFILVLCFLTSPIHDNLYTHRELMQMPSLELYDLFLDNGLILPDSYKEKPKEELADYLKNNFDNLSQGFAAASYTEHQDFAQSVKDVYEKITHLLGTKIAQYYKEDKNDGGAGYLLEIHTSKIPLSKIKGSILELKDEIVKQHKQQNVYSSTSPGFWTKEFSSGKEAVSYIGLKDLRHLNWNYGETYSNISLYGNNKGEFEYISVENDYEVDNIRMQATSVIYTDKFKDELSTSMHTTEELEFYDTYLCTDKHLRFHSISTTANENGYCMMDHFLVMDDILYCLHQSYKEEDASKALELAYEWADVLDNGISSHNNANNESNLSSQNSSEDITEIDIVLSDDEYIAMIEDSALKEWVNNCSNLDTDLYFEEYNNQSFQRIVINPPSASSPDISSDIFFSKANSEETLSDILMKMIDSIMMPYTKEETGFFYVITDYYVEKQRLIPLGEKIWLIPYLNVYMKYEGTGFAGTMEQYINSEPNLCREGYMPLFRQGSSDEFMYILMEKDGVYRLQRLYDIKQ
ncbi:MAG: M56 family metallopeptidase [Lachnospiraceae bacterium]|nr:M56 family metallopeptidase [Lachnospiraceae bacterium]